MAEIKSALELALERTKDIKSDPEGLRRREAEDNGKRLYAQLQEDPDFDITKALKDVSKETRKWVRQGLFKVAKTNLTLPQTENDLTKVDTIERALSELVTDRKMLAELLQQIRQFFRQYLEDRQKVTENLRRQYEPRMRQKEQQLEQQYGRKVRLDPASDPEFSRVLQDHIGQLDNQYRDALEQVNQHLQTMFREK